MPSETSGRGVEAGVMRIPVEIPDAEAAVEETATTVLLLLLVELLTPGGGEGEDEGEVGGEEWQGWETAADPSTNQQGLHASFSDTFFLPARYMYVHYSWLGARSRFRSRARFNAR